MCPTPNLMPTLKGNAESHTCFKEELIGPTWRQCKQRIGWMGFIMRKGNQ